MTSNYGPTTYTDGTPIPEVNDANTWKNLTTGAWRWVDSNDQARGKFYNYFAIEGIHDDDPTTPNKQFIPDGWRLPTRNDFTSTLHTYLNNYGYTPIAQTVGFDDYWQSENSSGCNCPGYSMYIGNDPNLNRTGLGIMPNGWINGADGSRGYLNQRSYLWTSDPSNNNIWTVYYRHELANITTYAHQKKTGSTVRLIRDYTSEGNSDIGLVSNERAPLHDTSTSYSYSQSLYPVSVLGDLKSISKITWFADANINLSLIHI